MASIELQVSHGDYDVSSDSYAGGRWHPSDDYMYMWGGGPAMERMHAFLFTLVNIPQGSTIISATLSRRCDADEDGSGGPSVVWKSEDEDTATVIADRADLLSRTLTTNLNTETPLGAYVDGTWYDTSVVDSIQEIISRPGWSSNNALQVIGYVNDPGTEDIYFRIDTYEQTSVYAPKLTIVYTPPAAEVRGYAAIM